jgi:hypothetical protein
MKNFRKAQCPYCERKLSLLNCWFLKTQGEYKCPKCGGISNIELDSTVILIALLAVLLSGILFAFHLFFVQTFSFTYIFLVFLPFFLFFILSILLVRLRKPAMRKRPPEQVRRPHSIEPPDDDTGMKTYPIEPPDSKEKNAQGNGHTIVMNYVKRM